MDGQAWSFLFLLGAYHGVNPGMGWLFAVALGMQERSGRAVGRSLLPIGLGHGLAIGAVVALAGLAQVVLPLGTLKVCVAVILFAIGLYYLLGARHFGWGGMQVGFAGLTFWSFLMASAHGAGLMVLPFLFAASLGAYGSSSLTHASHLHPSSFGPWAGLSAVLIHTAGYLLATAVVAWIVYRKLGVAVLRRAWLNLNWVWAIALVATGLFVIVSLR